MAISQDDFYRATSEDVIAIPSQPHIHVYDKGVTRDGQVYLLIGPDLSHLTVVTWWKGAINDHPADSPSPLNDPQAGFIPIVSSWRKQ